MAGDIDFLVGAWEESSREQFTLIQEYQVSGEIELSNDADSSGHQTVIVAYFKDGLLHREDGEAWRQSYGKNNLLCAWALNGKVLGIEGDGGLMIPDPDGKTLIEVTPAQFDEACSVLPRNRPHKQPKRAPFLTVIQGGKPKPLFPRRS